MSRTKTGRSVYVASLPSALIGTLTFCLSVPVSRAECDPSELRICFDSNPSANSVEAEVNVSAGDVGSCLYIVQFKFKHQLPYQAHQTCNDEGATACHCSGPWYECHPAQELVDPHGSSVAWGPGGCGCRKDLLYCLGANEGDGEACFLSLCGGTGMCDTDNACNRYYSITGMEDLSATACDSVTHRSWNLELDSCEGNRQLPATNGDTVCCVFRLGEETTPPPPLQVQCTCPLDEV
jgi:hypothetical protein